MSDQFKDHVAIITGDASRIGLAIVKKLSRGGAKCYRT